jgi:DNA processing protein
MQGELGLSQSMGGAQAPSSSPDWPAWYRLHFTYGLRFPDKLALLKRFQLAERVFEASLSELASVVSLASAQRLLSPPDNILQRIQDCGRWLAADARHCLLSLADPRYPQGFLHLADPPLLLFVRGRLDVLNAPTLAVVGSRSASAQGIENARGFSKAMAQAGYVIVSGLALGIDAAAHEGALAGRGPTAATIAVVGTGLDRVYPSTHRDLDARIMDQGAVISELELGAAPLPNHFPKRNRLISALAHGVLVVEAAKQSGSLITARLANDLGRDVFAIPGSIHSAVSKGCHLLIKQGAKLVESAEDILNELQALDDSTVERRSLPTKAAAGSEQVFTQTSGDDAVLQTMGHEPVRFLDILKRSGFTAAALQEHLLELELRGQISRLDDGRLLQIVEAT